MVLAVKGAGELQAATLEALVWGRGSSGGVRAAGQVRCDCGHRDGAPRRGAHGVLWAPCVP